MLFFKQYNPEQRDSLSNRIKYIKQNKVHIIISRKLPMVPEFKMDSVEISLSLLIKAFVVSCLIPLESVKNKMTV